MNVLILSEMFYPHGSGGELATFLYSQLLNEAGNKIVVVTNRFQGEPESSKNRGLQIYRLPLFVAGEGKYSTLGRFDILFSSYFKKLLKWADVVYIPKYWYSAIIMAKIYHKPVVVHSHGLLPICPLSIAYDVSRKKICSNKMPFCLSCIYNYERASGRRLLQSFASSILNDTVGSCFSQAIKLSNAIIVVSESQRNLLIKNVPALREKIHTIYNPLPNLPYTKINDDDFGYFGGPKIQKGFHVLCQALACYRERVNSTSVKVHSTCFNTANAEYVKQLELRGIIAYGKVDEISYGNIYRKIRAVIIPSVWPEVYGYVASEAFIRGRLVIASSIGGLPEVTAGCPGALLFRPGDYRELSDQLDIVKGLSRERAVDLGARNREVILKKYSNKIIIEQFMDLLARVID
jgi:glycosyltransferase involved in cell wall biosynthesis